MPMTDAELKALLQAERNQSLGGTLNSDLSADRSKAMEYYNGEMPDMVAAEGRSKAVSTDVADTIEGLMPPLMEIFAAGEEVVRFEPVGPEDEEAAKQETDYTNHVFMQKNPGFMVLYTFMKDALLSKNGVIKVYWDKLEREERETYLDQADDAFMMLATQPDVEIAEHTQKKDEQGQITHDVTLVRRKGYGCAKAVAVPPEEFGITKRARTIADSTYCFHELNTLTEQDLIEQGFDEDQVKSLPSMGPNDKEETQARDTINEDETASDSLNRSARIIRVIEHYIRMDYEDNGKPGLYCVTTGGGQLEVLRRGGKPAVEPVDVMPFAAMTPIPVTHRFYGRSLADIVMDIQRIKTALLRSLLDNIYLMNNQRMEVAESYAHERTLDDLLTNRPGAPIRTKNPGGLIPVPNQPIGTALYPALEYLDATREARTGVTRQGQGLDANALQNQSATAVNQAFTAAQARMKLIARIFAETGVRDMFALLHGCIRKNDKQVNTVRLRNKWVQVDPRSWKTRDDMTINVGLGTGSKEAQVAHLMNVMAIQEKALMAKLPIVTPKNIYNTAAKVIEKIDLKTVEPYFTDPESEQGMQMAQAAAQQPDPEMMKLQAEQQLKQQEFQQNAEREKIQAQADIATNDRKIAADISLAQQKFEFDKELKLIDAGLRQREFEMEQARKDREHMQEMQLASEQHSQTMQTAALKTESKQEPEEKNDKSDRFADAMMAMATAMASPREVTINRK